MGGMPYGGFRKAPTKFTDTLAYTGHKEMGDDDSFWICECEKANYALVKLINSFVFPNYPYMAIRNRPFRQVMRTCWSCGHVQTNITLEEAKIKCGEK